MQANTALVQPGTSWSGPFGYASTDALLAPGRRRISFQRFREKRWCYLGLFHPDIIFGCAVIHLGYISSAFVFGFDRNRRRMTEHTRVFPPLGQIQHDRNPEAGICQYRSLTGHLTISHAGPSGTTRIKTAFRLPGKSLQADVSVHTPSYGFSPVHFLMPMENQQRAFTTKAAGLEASGQIHLNKYRFDLPRCDTRAVLDWTNGFYPRQTFWNWACGAGTSKNGIPVGFNFSAGVYTRGLEENIVWINGTPYPTGPVDFIYKDKTPLDPWRINSRDGRVRLTFRPEGIRRANDNFGVVKSRFMQPCGRYTVSLNCGSGRKFDIRDIAGVAEAHYARW